MKRNELKEIKNLDPKDILVKVKLLKTEVANIRLDRFNSTKSKQGSVNLKDTYLKRKTIAQMLTIARQKQILSELELSNKQSLRSQGDLKNQELSEKKSEKEIVMDDSAKKTSSKKKGKTESSK